MYMKRSSRELLQESHVRIVQQPYIGKRVPQHCNACRSHSESPAGVFLRINSGGFENVRMHHPRAEDFHPSCAFACSASCSVTELALDIHFCGRLGEREITRTESRFRFAEEAIRE